MVAITKEELKKIVELVETVPQEYRQKCFEILLSHSLQATTSTSLPLLPSGSVSSQVTIPSKAFVLPIDVKAFLGQYGLEEPLLWKFYFIEGDQVRPIYRLSTRKKAVAQIQHALMLSLENAIATGQFQVDVEVLRSRCQDQKCYDRPNFMKNIKANANLFKTVAGDQPMSLSPDGKSTLADLLEQLKK
jgi:hypothetical protein